VQHRGDSVKLRAETRRKHNISTIIHGELQFFLAIKNKEVIFTEQAKELVK